MFRAGIKPEWEDPQNVAGSEFRIEIKCFNNNDLIQQVWQKTVFDLVLGNIPHVNEAIAGIRINQRQKGFSFINFRMEVWMTTCDEKSPMLQDIKKYLEETIIDDILKDQNNAQCKFDARDGFRADMKAK